jgi:iron complex outermembrane recepter protein
MIKTLLRSLLVTTAMSVALPTMALAQEALDNSADAIKSGEIIVTARRESESLQDIPVSVQVVTGQTIQNLAITSVEELSKLAPGLTLVNAGSSTGVTLRGVTWQPGSGTPATPIYFNEVPFDPGQTIVSLFDVGQIEVLRGPQGTSRGAPSISGAVTISTRKPDLNEFGGYVRGLYGSGDHWDLQAAVNVPIIQDVLAVRLAANIEESDGNRVYSVNSNAQPLFKDRSYRATVLFKPADSFTFEAMYQRRKTETKTYFQVAGTGSPGLAALPIPGIRAGIPANFNGPALSFKDRASVQDLPSSAPQHVDLLTVNASWEVFGQKLSYNYGRQFNRSGLQFNSNDPLNILPGFEPFNRFENLSLPKFRTHEIRLSSMPDPDRPFDYDIGWFSKRSGGRGINFYSPVYLNGAFGNPITTTPGAVTVPDPRYVLDSTTNIQLGQVFDSFYGNVRFHLTDRTELSGGLAIVRDRVPVSLAINTTAATTSIGSLFGLSLSFPEQFRPLITSCEVAGAFSRQPFVTSTVYPGTCELGLPAGPRPGQVNNDEYSKALYNFSLSHKFTDDLLVYAATGTSFRTGLPAINNAGLPVDLVTPNPETATSYEVGVKASVGRNLRVNAAVFQLDYKNQLTTFEGVRYFNTVSGAPAQTSLAFYRNVDARVRGFEFEVAANPVENLSLGANISYSKIKSQGGQVPCNDLARAITEDNPINFCTSAKGQVLNTQAPFQASINGSYEVPFTDSMGAYFRFNVNHQGANPNFGKFRTGDGFKRTPSYQIVDLFAGLSGNNGGWDIGVYAKNAFDKTVELQRIATINSIYPSFGAPAGYDVVRTNRPREVGVSLRYAFGSR